MDCYIISGSEKNDVTFSRGRDRYLSPVQMQEVLHKTAKLANLLKANGAKKVRVYGSSETKSSHILSIVAPKLIGVGLLSEEDVFTDSSFNGREYGSLENFKRSSVKRIKALTDKPSANLLRANLNMDNDYGIEKKKDYKLRVFDAVTRVVMENTDNSPAILIVGDDFIKTCQKDPYIHSMIYFGDEKFYIPSIMRDPASFSHFGYDPLIIQLRNEAFINASALESTKEFPELSFQKTIFEAPRVDSLGNVSPVYEKYAKLKAKEELDSQKANG